MLSVLEKKIRVWTMKSQNSNLKVRSSSSVLSRIKLLIDCSEHIPWHVSRENLVARKKEDARQFLSSYSCSYHAVRNFVGEMG